MGKSVKFENMFEICHICTGDRKGWRSGRACGEIRAESFMSRSYLNYNIFLKEYGLNFLHFFNDIGNGALFEENVDYIL